MSFANLILFFVFLTNFISGIYSLDSECSYLLSKQFNSSDRRTDKNIIRLVQYNVEWMFYDYYSASNCPGSGCVWPNQSEVLIHMDYISNIINDLNPDIVNFCEIEGCNEIGMIINKTNPLFNPYLIKGTDTTTGQNVGMMSLINPIIDLYRVETKYDYPISNSQCGYTDGSGTIGVSKHYITQFKFIKSDLTSIDIVMISAHLLAYPTDPERCAKREAQALVLQEQIYTFISQGYEVIIIGDLNDWDNKILDINNKKPISQVLDILKGNKGKYSSQYVLKSIGDKISQNQRYSEYWDENVDCIVQSTEFSMIDHILLTPNLYSMVSNAFAFHAYPHSCDGNSYNSDHDPIVIDIQL